VQLAGKIDWEFIDGEIAPLCCDGGRLRQWRKSRNRRGMAFQDGDLHRGARPDHLLLHCQRRARLDGVALALDRALDQIMPGTNATSTRSGCMRVPSFGAAARRCILQLSVVACLHSEGAA
jgi:hypothetical protein